MNTNKKRTAVLFYGMLRNYKIPSQTVIKKITGGSAFDAFFFGPGDTDRPDSKYSTGQQDSDGFFIKNPKEGKQITVKSDFDGFAKIYKGYLRSHKVHSLDSEYFEKMSQSLRPREDWLMGLNPSRMLSMFYNMSGVIDLFLKENAIGLRHYEKIILTRTDLVFYNEPACQINSDEVHIPCGEGFSSIGEKYIGNASVFYYKNMETGDYVSGGRKDSFNDQIMIMTPNSLEKLRDLYRNAIDLIEAKAPLSPETILFILMKRNNMKIIPHPEWEYEIYRDGKRHIDSLMETEELARVDRYNPRIFKHAVFQSSTDIDTSFSSITGDGKFYRNIEKRILSSASAAKRIKFNKDPISFLLDTRNIGLRIIRYHLLKKLESNGTRIFYPGKGRMITKNLGSNNFYNNIELTDPTETFVIFGPYIDLPAGSYKAQMKISNFDYNGPMLLEVVSQNLGVISTVSFDSMDRKKDGFLSIEWKQDNDAEDLEVRLKTYNAFCAKFDYLVLQNI